VLLEMLYRTSNVSFLVVQETKLEISICLIDFIFIFACDDEKLSQVLNGGNDVSIFRVGLG
jgi:hypothetical protein